MNAPTLSNEPTPTDGTNGTVLVTQRQQRIRELAISAKASAQRAKDELSKAIDDAYECGHLLSEEKEELKASSQRLNWEDYCEAHFGDVLTVKEAGQWMTQLYFAFRGEGIDSTRDQNMQRAGASVLRLYPSKAYEPPPGEAAMPRGRNHMTSINEFMAWRSAYKAQHQDRYSDAYVERLLIDFTPVLEFLAFLRKKQGEM